tara:strand:- start:107 stop:688 length:582 start_codon:yes stop_codon:yes gene_type:complete
MSFEKYSKKHKTLMQLLRRLREIEEQCYVLIDCRTDLETDLILNRHGFNPEHKETNTLAKKIENLETMMDQLDKERREIYSKLNKLRTSTESKYSSVNRKLLVGMTEGSLTNKEKFHMSNYLFRTLSNRSSDETVKGAEFILMLVNTGKYNWSEAQEMLNTMNDSGLVYEVRNDIYRSVERSGMRNVEGTESV